MHACSVQSFGGRAQWNDRRQQRERGGRFCIVHTATAYCSFKHAKWVLNTSCICIWISKYFKGLKIFNLTKPPLQTLFKLFNVGNLFTIEVKIQYTAQIYLQSCTQSLFDEASHTSRSVIAAPVYYNNNIYILGKSGCIDHLSPEPLKHLTTAVYLHNNQAGTKYINTRRW